MAVWKLTKEQKEKYKNTYLDYMKNYPDEFTYDFIKGVIIDFKTIRLIVNENVLEFKKKHSTYDLNDLIEHVYNKLENVTLITQHQTLKDVKEFNFWDIDFCDITGTIHIDIENKNLELSEYVNGYTKVIFSEPFEDLHVEVLEEILTDVKKNR